MKLPRDLSGRQLAQALCKSWGYVEVHQTGSHIIIETEQPSHQRIAVPAHQSLRIGTLNAILRAVSQHKQTTRDEILRAL
ncbi:type II toxin-antitoxin system HicA family toxin [Myxococcota bacterium]